MATRYRIEVTLDEDDPSEVLDWIQEHSGDETASVEDLATVLSSSLPGTDRDAIWATLQTLDLAGYRITRVDYGDGPVAITDLDHALAEATCADEAWVTVEKDDVQGWVYFVLGNSPEEVICDHAVNLSDVLDPLTDGWWNQ